MALTEAQQIDNALKNSQHILIVFKQNYSVDAVASALAMYQVLKKQNKLVDIICADFSTPQKLKFLEGVDKILPDIANLQKFIITLDTKKGAIDQFSYNIEDGKLKIYITPKSGTFSPKDVAAESSDYKYDLIITLDTPDLASLGKIYEKFSDFFAETTILNIDHHADNERYGQINLVNPNTVATSELLYRLIHTLDTNLIDKSIATCLLCGMIAKSKSFKAGNVTPKTMEIAGNLMTLEADRELIVKNLYRNRSLPVMKLWGRALSRLKSEQNNSIVWSILTDHDFIESGADQQSLSDIIDELISFIPGSEVAVIMYQMHGSIHVVVRVLQNYNALQLCSEFKADGNRKQCKFSLSGANIMEAEKRVIDALKNKIAQS